MKCLEREEDPTHQRASNEACRKLQEVPLRFSRVPRSQKDYTMTLTSEPVCDISQHIDDQSHSPVFLELTITASLAAAERLTRIQ